MDRKEWFLKGLRCKGGTKVIGRGDESGFVCMCVFLQRILGKIEEDFRFRMQNLGM